MKLTFEGRAMEIGEEDDQRGGYLLYVWCCLNLRSHICRESLWKYLLPYPLLKSPAS